MALCVAFAAGAQTEWPWNPDSDADNIIGVEDLLAVLSVFGAEFYVEYPAPASSPYTLALVQANDSIFGYADCLGYCAAIGGHIVTIEEFGLFHEQIEQHALYTYTGSASNPPSESWRQKLYLNPNSLERKMDHGLTREIDIYTDSYLEFIEGDTVFNHWDYSSFPAGYGWGNPTGNLATRAECFCAGITNNPAFVTE